MHIRGFFRDQATPSAILILLNYYVSRRPRNFFAFLEFTTKQGAQYTWQHYCCLIVEIFYATSAKKCVMCFQFGILRPGVIFGWFWQKIILCLRISKTPWGLFSGIYFIGLELGCVVNCIMDGAAKLNQYLTKIKNPLLFVAFNAIPQYKVDPFGLVTYSFGWIWYSLFCKIFWTCYHFLSLTLFHQIYDSWFIKNEHMCQFSLLPL